jgi:hypothetical protein
MPSLLKQAKDAHGFIVWVAHMVCIKTVVLGTQ